MTKTNLLVQGFCALVLVAVLGGCASDYKKEAAQEQEAKAMPVNCATAPADIRTLEDEKISAAKQAAAGVSAVFPIGLVSGLATHTEGDKVQLANGDYNKALETKIAEIKKTCNIH